MGLERGDGMKNYVVKVNTGYVSFFKLSSEGIAECETSMSISDAIELNEPLAKRVAEELDGKIEVTE